ncbi:hypothetical protein DIPPA_65230 [Diplonema papillatum]|nr:hypothetical protein DIPPA_65231 [Diplonema papillatum]KAJ9440915.1 hypothetical protein DIPPA_65230 [Diplonema papillatum]
MLSMTARFIDEIEVAVLEVHNVLMQIVSDGRNVLQHISGPHVPTYSKVHRIVTILGKDRKELQKIAAQSKSFEAWVDEHAAALGMKASRSCQTSPLGPPNHHFDARTAFDSSCALHHSASTDDSSSGVTAETSSVPRNAVAVISPEALSLNPLDSFQTLADPTNLATLSLSLLQRNDENAVVTDASLISDDGTHEIQNHHSADTNAAENHEASHDNGNITSYEDATPSAKRLGSRAVETVQHAVQSKSGEQLSKRQRENSCGSQESSTTQNSTERQMTTGQCMASTRLSAHDEGQLGEGEKESKSGSQELAGVQSAGSTEQTDTNNIVRAQQSGITRKQQQRDLTDNRRDSEEFAEGGDSTDSKEKMSSEGEDAVPSVRLGCAENDHCATLTDGVLKHDSTPKQQLLDETARSKPPVAASNGRAFSIVQCSEKTVSSTAIENDDSAESGVNMTSTTSATSLHSATKGKKALVENPPGNPSAIGQESAAHLQPKQEQASESNQNSRAGAKLPLQVRTLCERKAVTRPRSADQDERVGGLRPSVSRENENPKAKAKEPQSVQPQKREVDRTGGRDSKAVKDERDRRKEKAPAAAKRPALGSKNRIAPRNAAVSLLALKLQEERAAKRAALEQQAFRNTQQQAKPRPSVKLAPADPPTPKTISDLPPELLVAILDYFPLVDGSVRLFCRGTPDFSPLTSVARARKWTCIYMEMLRKKRSVVIEEGGLHLEWLCRNPPPPHLEQHTIHDVVSNPASSSRKEDDTLSTFSSLDSASLRGGNPRLYKKLPLSRGVPPPRSTVSIKPVSKPHARRAVVPTRANQSAKPSATPRSPLESPSLARAPQNKIVSSSCGKRYAQDTTDTVPKVTSSDLQRTLSGEGNAWPVFASVQRLHVSVDINEVSALSSFLSRQASTSLLTSLRVSRRGKLEDESFFLDYHVPSLLRFEANSPNAVQPSFFETHRKLEALCLHRFAPYLDQFATALTPDHPLAVLVLCFNTPLRSSSLSCTLPRLRVLGIFDTPDHLPARGYLPNLSVIICRQHVLRELLEALLNMLAVSDKLSESDRLPASLTHILSIPSTAPSPRQPKVLSFSTSDDLPFIVETTCSDEVMDRACELAGLSLIADGKYV